MKNSKDLEKKNVAKNTLYLFRLTSFLTLTFIKAGVRFSNTIASTVLLVDALFPMRICTSS